MGMNCPWGKLWELGNVQGGVSREEGVRLSGRVGFLAPLSPLISQPRGIDKSGVTILLLTFYFYLYILDSSQNNFNNKSGKLISKQVYGRKCTNEPCKAYLPGSGILRGKLKLLITNRIRYRMLSPKFHSRSQLMQTV